MSKRAEKFKSATRGWLTLVDLANITQFDTKTIYRWIKGFRRNADQCIEHARILTAKRLNKRTLKTNQTDHQIAELAEFRRIGDIEDRLRARVKYL